MAVTKTGTDYHISLGRDALRGRGWVWAFCWGRRIHPAPGEIVWRNVMEIQFQLPLRFYSQRARD